MKAETTLRLAYDFDNIIAVKEASGDMEQIMEIIAKKPIDFKVLSGDDAITLLLFLWEVMVLFQSWVKPCQKIFLQW